MVDTVFAINSPPKYKGRLQVLGGAPTGILLKLSDISVSRIEEFKQSRLAVGVKPATVNRNLSVLRRMLTLATRQRYIARNPFMEVELLEEIKYRRQPHILTWEEQNRILTVAAPHLRVLIVLLTETGLRVNKEALSLKWEDIDFKGSQLLVIDSKSIVGRRTLPLSELCKSELLRWRKLVGSEYSPYVFPNLNRPGHHILCVRKAWSTTLRAASVPYFPIYYLRATFASRLSASSGHLRGTNARSFVNQHPSKLCEGDR